MLIQKKWRYSRARSTQVTIQNMDLRVFLGAFPSRTEAHSKVSTKPGMQKAENSPAQFQANKRY